MKIQARTEENYHHPAEDEESRKACRVDYSFHAQLLEIHRQLDEAGLGPSLARLRYAPAAPSPQRPTKGGRLVAALLRPLTPLVWRILRGGATDHPYSLLYDTILRHMEWQWKIHHQLMAEMQEIHGQIQQLSAIVKKQERAE